MALDFPSSPTVGQQYLNWTWNGVAWVVTPGPPLASLAQSSNNAGRNLIDNALFQIQQRSVGPWSATGYTADRWLINFTADTTTASIIVLSDADRAGIGDEAARTAEQVQFTGASGAGAFTFLSQRTENVPRISGKTVTVSAWMKASAGTPRIGLGWYQYFGTGGSPSAAVGGNYGVTANLSTTWQRVIFTANIPSAAGKTYGTNQDNWTSLDFFFSDQGSMSVRSGGIGVQSGTVQIWGVQVEVGSQATPLEKLDPERDLARCQRFYQGQTQPQAFSRQGYGAAGVVDLVVLGLPVAMRALPTVTILSPSSSNLSSGPNLNAYSVNSLGLYCTVAAAGQFTMSVGYTASADL